MDDVRNPPPTSSSSAVGENRRHGSVEEDGGDSAACTGKSCESCTAGVIADCVAVCCCPCGVVSILTLAFLKLPWAVARKRIGGWRKKSRRQGKVEEKISGGNGNNSGEDGTSEIVSSAAAGDGVGGGGLGNDEFGEVWLELHEVERMGFGRVSFSEVPFHDRGN